LFASNQFPAWIIMLNNFSLSIFNCKLKQKEMYLVKPGVAADVS